ncbi:hypothetical protein OEZ86_012466 [Tetradesmus obliquus]|nr:hypothetical protein OEZ86_012466 [Tetradesmus obliquus]
MALCASRNMSVARATRQTAAPARVAARQVVRASRRNAVVVNAAAPLIGSKAPAFKATAVFDQEFVDVSLDKYKGQYVVLFFYPLDFTFVCPTEITAFSDRHAEFKSIGAEVLGVSVDSQFTHLAWIQTDRKEGGLGDLAYPLVADLKKEISEALAATHTHTFSTKSTNIYLLRFLLILFLITGGLGGLGDLAYPLVADLKKEISEAYGVLTDEGIALRGLFIIDKEGVVQHATINNLAFGRSVDETLRTLQAIQYVQSNPDEVCPAGWKPGDKTMKPDPKGSKEYFAAI